MLPFAINQFIANGNIFISLKKIFPLKLTVNIKIIINFIASHIMNRPLEKQDAIP